jgi:D-amino peptidase
MPHRLLTLFLACAACVLAQGPRILIVTDMEGVGGVNNADEQLLPGQRRFEESRRILTGELNAAVAAAKAAGASNIVVWDGHDGSRSLALDELDPHASLIQGRPTPANYYFSERLYDGVMFIGQHAMAGAKGGVLAHSQSFNVERITINGKPVGEIGQLAAVAGYFHIPVIMLAGDQAACEEILDLQPRAETVAVKRLAGKNSSLSLPHAVAKEKIREAVTRAVKNVKSYKPWVIDGPVELKFEYKPEANRPGASYRGATVLAAFEEWLGKP